MPKKQTILEKNPVLIEQFYQLIEAGIPPTRACNYIKIATSTYFSWMAKGRQEKSGIYFNFRNEVLKSETKCMLKNILLVQKAAQEGKVSAAIWLLENRFGMRNKEPEIEINISMVESNNIQSLIDKLAPTEELLKLKGPEIDVDEK